MLMFSFRAVLMSGDTRTLDPTLRVIFRGVEKSRDWQSRLFDPLGIMGTIEQDHIRFLIALNGRSIWRPRGRIHCFRWRGKGYFGPR